MREQTDASTRPAVQLVAAEPSHASDSGLAALPFTGLAVLSLALVGLAQLLLGTTLRRLTRRPSA